jgi:Thiamine-binding protein
MCGVNVYFSTEGPWDAVMRVIGQAHTMVHEKGVARVQTDIRVGTRYGCSVCLSVCLSACRLSCLASLRVVIVSTFSVGC